jgi:hypothetical protein
LTNVINLLGNKSNSLPYIDYSIGRYQKYVLPNIYISTNQLHFLLGNNFFSATEYEYVYRKSIRTLQLHIWPFRLKFTPSRCLCAVDVRNNQFVVAHFLPIHLQGVFYTRFEQVFGEILAAKKCKFEVWVCYLWVLILPSSNFNQFYH